MTTRPSLWSRALAVVGTVMVATMVVGSSAGAVIGGAADGGRHPYAGAVDGRPVGGPVRFGSGVLIVPRSTPGGSSLR